MSVVEFDQDELDLLRAGLLEWGGPASPTDAIARALGFSGAKMMSTETRDLWTRIERGDRLDADEWRRVLLAVEVVFVSDVVGSGIDWSITTGIPDAEAIAILRRLQRKLPRWRRGAQFTVEDSRVAINDPERPTP